MVMANQVEENSFRSTIFLVALAAQVGIQPLLMHWFAADANNVTVKVAVIEGMKLTAAAVMLFQSGSFWNELLKWEFKEAAYSTFLPALIYAWQNYLNQSAVIILDGVTFNILNQTKIIWTALFVYVMLGRIQSKQQIVAMLLLISGAVIMTNASSSKKHDKENLRYLEGVIKSLIAAATSGLAGTIVQKSLQHAQRNPYIVTIELSAFAIGGLMVSALGTNDGVLLASGNAFDGWTILTFSAMFVQAMGGVIVGFVIKYSGNVKKSFAAVAGLSITAVLEWMINSKPFGIQGIFAIFLVGVSTYMYTVFPPDPSSAKPKFLLKMFSA